MQRDDRAAVVDALVDGGAVERFPYQVGERSFGYRLAARFVADPHIQVMPIDQRLIEQLDLVHRRFAKENKSRLKPVHYRLEQLQRRLQIDGDQARDILARKPITENAFDSQGVLNRDIGIQDHHFSVGNYGRVADSITSLKRELRDALHINGERLGSVDLNCSQPAFIAKLMETAANQPKERRGRKQPAVKHRRKGKEHHNGSKRQGTSNHDAGRIHYDAGHKTNAATTFAATVTSCKTVCSTTSCSPKFPKASLAIP